MVVSNNKKDLLFRGERRVVRMSLQELAALETQQAIESANYENADVTYAVINEADLLQVRIVIRILVLVFVWQRSK